MKTPETSMAADRPRRRDARVDQIGFVGEIVKQWIEAKDEGVKARVKRAMEEGEIVEGDFFEGRLDASTGSEISVSGILKLFEAGKLSRAELVSLLTVKKSEAEAVIPPKDLKRLTTTYAGTPRLTVGRKKGVNVDLVQCVMHLSSAFAEGSEKPTPQ